MKNKIALKNTVIRRTCLSGTYYQVRTHWQDKNFRNRIATDCQYFKSRKEAIAAIPTLSADIIDSIEKGMMDY